MTYRFCNACRVMTLMMTSAWGESATSRWSLLRRATLVRHRNASTYCCNAFSQLLRSPVALMVFIPSHRRSSSTLLFAFMGTFLHAGLSHNSTETQHTLLKAAGRLDSAHSADPSEGQSKAGADPQSCSHEADHPLTIPDFAVEPQPSLHPEASLARQITLGKGDLPLDGPTCPQQPFADTTEDAPLDCHAAGRGSAEGTEMLSMGSRAGRHLAAGAPVCSSPPCEAWPSILLQPQDASLPAQAPSQASLQLPDASSEAPPETPHFPPHAPAGLDDRSLLLPEPFGSSVMRRPSEDTQPLPALDAAPETASTVVQQAEVPVLPGRGPATDMLATPSRLSRASSAMATESSSQAAMPPTPTSIAAECSSPPSLAAVYSGRDDGRAAGAKGSLSNRMPGQLCDTIMHTFRP